MKIIAFPVSFGLQNFIMKRKVRTLEKSMLQKLATEHKTYKLTSVKGRGVWGSVNPWTAECRGLPAEECPGRGGGLPV